MTIQRTQPAAIARPSTLGALPAFLTDWRFLIVLAILAGAFIVPKLFRENKRARRRRIALARLRAAEESYR